VRTPVRAPADGWLGPPMIRFSPPMSVPSNPSRLSTDQVEELRGLWAQGRWTPRQLADRFGVSMALIRHGRERPPDFRAGTEINSTAVSVLPPDRSADANSRSRRPAARLCAITLTCALHLGGTIQAVGRHLVWSSMPVNVAAAVPIV
jgi:hypothetical protein